MDKFIIEETDLYQQLETKKEKEDYRKSFLYTLSCFGYLDQYGDFDFSELKSLNDIEGFNIQPICKTFFSLVYYKSEIQRDELTTKGTMNGYYDVIYNHEDTLNVIKNIMVYKDNHNKNVDFFK